MRAVELVMKKREAGELSEAEIRFLVQGYVRGEIPDYQMASWLMAVFFRGMSFQETGFLTRAMIDSGDVLHLDGVPGPLVDKHSTGGVGDKISLMLAPIAAACGVRVPMMSGRALGHTGGTLDKLDAIVGYRTALNQEEIRQGLRQTGFIMTGQSQEVVPADRLMYALRDVTATVESIPLITASILSKKFAEGAEALVFDVKCGRGAFMKTRESARALAVSLVETAKSLGRRAVAILTDMSEPLGKMTGNFLEVEEAVLFLRGESPEDLQVLTYRQAAWMLIAGGLCRTVEEGEKLAREAIDSGKAWDKFEENVRFQGGDAVRLIGEVGKRRARFQGDLKASQTGWLSGYDALECGLAATALGAGRNRKEDRILPEVGFEFLKKKGDKVATNEAIVRVWADDEAKLAETLSRLEKAYRVDAKEPTESPLILEEISAL